MDNGKNGMMMVGFGRGALGGQASAERKEKVIQRLPNMQADEDGSISMHGQQPWICRMYMEICGQGREKDSHFYKALPNTDDPLHPARFIRNFVYSNQQIMFQPQSNPPPSARRPVRSLFGEHPSSPTHSQKGSRSPASRSECSPENNKEYNLGRASEKQIKYYIRCVRKYKRRQELSRWIAWTQVLYRLLAADSQQIDYKPSSCSLKFSTPRPRTIRIHPTTIIDHSSSFPHTGLLLLSSRPNAASTQFLYDLAVLSPNGRIVYNRINLPDTRSLKTQIAAICLRFHFYIVTVECRDQLLAAIQGQEQQFRNQVGIWPQLRSIEGLSQSEREVLVREGGSIEKGERLQLSVLKTLARNVTKYVFLRREFLRRVGGIEAGAQLTQDDLRITALAHNLLCQWITPQSSFQQQITPLRETILTAFSQAQIRPKKLQISPETLLGHFPFTLGNAHICWRCKSKRTYTHCPSCSSAQTHVMALCLDCFEQHHRETVVVKRVEGRRTVEEWLQVDAAVGRVIGVGVERWKIEAKTQSPDPSIH